MYKSNHPLAISVNSSRFRLKGLKKFFAIFWRSMLWYTCAYFQNFEGMKLARLGEGEMRIQPSRTAHTQTGLLRQLLTRKYIQAHHQSANQRSQGDFALPIYSINNRRVEKRVSIGALRNMVNLVSA